MGTRWRIRKRTFAHVLTVDPDHQMAYARAAATDEPVCVPYALTGYRIANDQLLLLAGNRGVVFRERVNLQLNFEAFNAFNHTYFTGVLTQAYTASNGVLTPVPRLGEGNATGGFPDGTNARRVQVSARLAW